MPRPHHSSHTEMSSMYKFASLCNLDLCSIRILLHAVKTLVGRSSKAKERRRTSTRTTTVILHGKHVQPYVVANIFQQLQTTGAWAAESQGSKLNKSQPVLAPWKLWQNE